MNLFEKIDDTRGQTGIGTQLNVWDETLQKYKLFMPLETVPSVIGSTNTVDVDLLTSSLITKIEGKKTVDDKDVTFLWHRDNIAILRAASGKQLKFLVSYPDYTGWKFEGRINYKPDDASTDKLTGTFTIVANSVDEHETEDVRDMLARTCFITSSVDFQYTLKGTESKTITLSATKNDATFTATSNSTSVTANVVGKQLTLTGVSKGNAIVTIKASATGMASWETRTAVTVE